MSRSEFFSALGLAPERAFLSSPQEERAAIGREPVVAVLPHIGFIEVSGAEGVSFLHGQLTNDVQRQPPGSVQLSAYCHPKGRMLASFLQWQYEAGGERRITLAVESELAAPVAKRLSMFVLRAKAKVVDATATHVAFGWIGTPGSAPALPADAPALPGAPYTVELGAQYAIARVADVWGQQRYLIVVASEIAPAVWQALAAGTRVVGPGLWRLADIHAGIPNIVAATQERFVPQMVNYELIGGVNFRKGCYPGQEIVARSQYLGKQRRRMFLASGSVEAKAGDDVYEAGVAEPVGVIVNAEANGEDGADLLIETTLAASEGALSVAGAPLAMLPLPYALPAEQSAA